MSSNLYHTMTTAERNSAANVEEGVIVFDSTLNKKFRKTATGWLPVIQTTLLTVRDTTQNRQLNIEVNTNCVFDLQTAKYENWPTIGTSEFIVFPETGYYKLDCKTTFRSTTDPHIFRLGVDYVSSSGTTISSFAIADADSYKITLPSSGGISNRLCPGTAIIKVDSSIAKIRVWQYQFNELSLPITNGFDGADFMVQKIAELP